MVAHGEGGARLVGISSTSAIHGAPRARALRGGEDRDPRGHARTHGGAGPPPDPVQLAAPRLDDHPDEQARASRRASVRNTTERTPVRRWADPSDMGKAAVFLADPTYLFHTGDELVVDGGYTRY